VLEISPEVLSDRVIQGLVDDLLIPLILDDVINRPMAFAFCP
jgi:hypothetical protein